LDATRIITSFNCKPLQCVCTHLINPTNIHLSSCTHGNECIGTHDVIHCTFTVIAQDVKFHVGQEQLYVIPSTTFNSSHWRVDIVIADPMHTNLIL
jgi:hypothetical protein